MREQNNQVSLISQTSQQYNLYDKKQSISIQPSFKQKTSSKLSKCKIIFIVLITIAVGFLIYGEILLFKGTQDQIPIRIIYPKQLKLAICDNITIIKGNSRVVEVIFYSGYDDRGKQPFRIVNQRDIIFTTQPQGIISIDQYGRIQALQQGTTILKVISSNKNSIYDTKIINVIQPKLIQYRNFNQTTKRIINYTGVPSSNIKNLQKLVTRIPKQEVQKSPQIPESIKKVSLDPENSQKKTMISQKNGDIVWIITKYIDGSNNTYIKRAAKIDQTLKENSKDQIMHFIGNRYLPDDGKYALSIQDDQKLGLWVVGKSGSVTHIQMINLSYQDKAQLMVQNTQQFVIRQGIASGADYDTNKNKWIPAITDNDGLWTALYAAGQLMRYDYLRRIHSSAQKIKIAKESAIPSLKAVLITDWISGRSGTINAKIRSFNNTRISRGQRLSNYYLKNNKTFAVQNYAGSPCDTIGYYGLDANQTVDGMHFGGSFKYSLHPLNMSDWTQKQQAATTKRTLDGFMARTFAIPEIDGTDRYSGLFFQRFQNGSHKVLNSASALYDYTNQDHPLLQIGNQPLPQILKSILKVNKKQYGIYDMVYKGETSTDQVIGHLFLYKIAFDIMDQNDPQQNQLKDLIRKTMIRFTQHLLNNGYQMVDATGQGTSWSKLVRDFLNNDYTTQDAPLKALQLLLCFKLTYYVTGDEKYQTQYQFLINDPSFKYAELIKQFWARWVYLNQNEDYDLSQRLYRFNFTKNTTEQQLLRHHYYTFHYSDDQQALLAFYLIFQLQKNQDLLKFYKIGLNAYWNHINKSQNPLWYYIYQLAYPYNEQLKDGFGNSLLQTASWQLSRHPIDTTRYQAFIQGSRLDVIYEGTISVDPYKILGKRTNQADVDYVNKTQTYKINSQFNPWNFYQIHTLPADERSIHKFNGVNYQNIHSYSINTMEPSTTYTLPYWFGVYHGMLKYQD